jgi:tRNA A-37 threonylcarbamoyl transferase component Bud32
MSSTPKSPRDPGSTSLISGQQRAVGSDSPSVTVAPVEMGDYEVMEELGRGGMGVVYRAREKSLGRIVALKKVLMAQTHPSILARFQQEARAAAALDHPGIVPLFRVGEMDGQPFFTMAYIDGESLSTLLHREGPVPPRRAGQLLVQVADAVAYAHERGIIHRDLKPDNILLDRQGNPRITDFGLARRLDAGPNLTSQGLVVGTPSYMAPEQAQGDTNLTPAVDVYSLGAVLHALLVGQAPFTGSSVHEVLMKVTMLAPPPLRQINPALPQELETIVLRCLEKDPARRYLSAADLAADLRAWLEGQPSTVARAGKADPTMIATAPAPSGSGRKPARLALIAVCLLVAAGAVFAAWWVNRDLGSDWTKARRQDFALKVSLGGSLARDNQGVYLVPNKHRVQFVIESPIDVHVGIWSIQSNGVLRLLPNDDEKDTFIGKQSTRLVPGQGRKGFISEPSDPPGEVEYFRIVARTGKWTPVKADSRHEVFAVFTRGSAAFAKWETEQAGLRGLRGVRLESGDKPSSQDKVETTVGDETGVLVSEVVLPYRVAE